MEMVVMVMTHDGDVDGDGVILISCPVSHGHVCTNNQDNK